MTDTTVTDAVVFPQDDGTGIADGKEDFLSAGYLSLLSKYEGDGSYVGQDTSGNATLQFANVDTTNEQVDVQSGFAYIMESGKTVQSASQNSYDTTLPNDAPYVVILPANKNNLGLGTDTSNDLWLAFDPSKNESVYIRHGSGLSAPNDPSVKLGTVNTSDGSTTRANDKPSPSFSAVQTGQVSLTDPSLLYAVGTNGNLREAYDPSDYADVFDAANAALADAGQTEQVSLFWPYTGDSAISATTTLDLVNRRVPNLYGYGRYGTRINYTATDGTPAIDVDPQGNGIDPEWSGFALIGPGKGAAGDGNGVQAVDGFNHGQSLRRLTVEQFPGHGILNDGNFLTGEVALCHLVENGRSGLKTDRFNVGTIRNNLIQQNGNSKGHAQLHVTDSLGGAVAFNDIDSRGGDGTLTQQPGILIEGIDKRGGIVNLANYYEDCSVGVIYRESGVPVGRGGSYFNRIQGSDTGIHVEAGNNHPKVAYNWFQSCGTQDVLLDDGAIFGPNSHFNSTTKVADNTGGDFDSVSQTSGSYPW